MGDDDYRVLGPTVPVYAIHKLGVLSTSRKYSVEPGRLMNFWAFLHARRGLNTNGKVE